MVLPPAGGDMCPSELLNRMKALMLLEELEWPSILFWHACLLISVRTACLSL